MLDGSVQWIELSASHHFTLRKVEDTLLRVLLFRCIDS